MRYKSTQKVKGGSSFKLEALISGVPTPDVAWFLNDKPISQSKDVSIESSATETSIVIAKSDRDYSGTYTVKAENSVGSASLDFTVEVKGKYFNIYFSGENQ